MKKNKFLILMALVCSFPAYAQQSVNNFQAKATLVASCTITASNIVFGQYDSNRGDQFSTGIITTKCSKGVSINIGLTNAIGILDNNDKYGAVAADGIRKWVSAMSGPSTDYLKFNIFQDPAHTKIFGNDNTVNNNFQRDGHQVSIYKVATGEVETTMMYAAVSGGQFVTPGVYSTSHWVSVYY